MSTVHVSGLICICIYRHYKDYTITCDTTETLSRDDVSGIDNCHQTTCIKLITDNALFGVLCVDHISNSMVRVIQPGYTYITMHVLNKPYTLVM